MTDEIKFDNTDDIYYRQDYEIFAPFKSNDRIFNHNDFSIETWRENGKKIVLIKNKKKEITK
ncbi:MAG TPA: hypothetical protein PKV21_07715 [bacterium]|nr:hypothetical protein [bacterium]